MTNFIRVFYYSTFILGGGRKKEDPEMEDKVFLWIKEFYY